MIPALRVASIFVAFALAWIHASDHILGLIVSTQDQFARYQTYKGSAFVVVTGLLIYLLVYSHLARLVAAKQDEANALMALSTAKEHRDLAFDAAQLGEWGCDLQSHTVHCDERAARHFGTTDAPTPEAVLERLHPLDLDRILRMKHEFLAGRPLPDTELRFKQHDGSYRWIAVSAIPKHQDGHRTHAIGTSQDIHQRKQAEQALADNMALLRTVTDTSGVGLVVLDRNRRYTFANAAYSKILGLPNNIVGMGPKELLASSYSTQIAPRLDEALNGERVQYELSLPSNPPGGEPRYYQVVYEPQENVAGEIECVVVVIYETTDLRRSEIALRESEQRLSYVMSATGEGVWDWSINTGVVANNARWCELLGLPGTELEHSYQLFIEHIHPGDQLAVQAAIAQCLHDKSSYQTEYRLMRSVGNYIWVHDRGRVVEQDSAGHPVRMVGSISDITARKDADKRQLQLLADLTESERDAHQQKAFFKAVFESTPDGLILVDLSRSIVDINPAFTAMFGYSIDDLRGRSTQYLYATQADFEKVGAHIRRGIDGPLDSLLDCKRKDGSLFPIQMTGARMLDSAGSVVGYLGVMRDVSLEQKRERALRESQRLEALGRLAGGIAHDFNNLLTIITGNLQLINSDVAPKDLELHLAEASRAAEMGARLNHRLMTFARQRKLEPIPIDLNEMVRSLLSLIRRSIGEGIAVELVLEASPAVIMIDESEMENAIVNLAINARDAMPSGGKLILETRNAIVDPGTIGLLGDITPGSYLQFAVSDTGTGMTADILARAFEPFFTTKYAGKGTGLGLTTLHGFVRQSGGAVVIYSEAGRGTSVNIYLPLPKSSSTPRIPNPSDAANEVKGSNEAILVVEDNTAVRRVTSEHLKLLGYNVLEADTAPRQFRCLKSTRISRLFSLTSYFPMASRVLNWQSD